MSSFASSRQLCETFENESNPLAMCTPDCLGPVNRTLGLCKNGETYEDEGQTMSVAETLGMILTMCNDPCFAAMVDIQSSGCMPKEEDGDDFNQAAVCREACKGKVEEFPVDCHQEQVPLSDMTWDTFLKGLQMVCNSTGPAPAPTPPASAGCIKINKAMGKRLGAMQCSS